MTAPVRRPPRIAPLIQFARTIYFGGDGSLAGVARVLGVRAGRVARWSARGGGWAGQRFQARRGKHLVWKIATTDAARIARRGVSRLERCGISRAEASRSLLAAVAALVLEETPPA